MAFKFLLSSNSKEHTLHTKSHTLRDYEPVVINTAVDSGGDMMMLVEGDGNDERDRGSEKGKVKRPWSPEEDVMLRCLVSKFCARNWGLIPCRIPGHSGKSCRLRWCNQLDLGIKHKPFIESCPAFRRLIFFSLPLLQLSLCANTLFVKCLGIQAVCFFPFFSSFRLGCRFCFSGGEVKVIPVPFLMSY
jgi:hypothetical protein